MHEHVYACGMQIGKANKGCRICTCACIRSEPAVEFVYTPVDLPMYFTYSSCVPTGYESMLCGAAWYIVQNILGHSVYTAV
jgi:hypothetical protein